ncbi:MAG: Ribosomal silencing factor RsfS [Pelotomaculum thermopropionicum]|uniref:Ribosomal silencing factor RsfS n=1 Tax=Pelotomaculum thermopropionicum TaxID=110500 RepID=A0A117M454_9FIRM|nr:MAG: Ribosomal silencing factor RsfS [Pelotomaculum thermopropionicum]
MYLNPRAMLKIAVQAAEDKKAEDITVLDIREVSIIADYFVICSGRSKTQAQAIAENIQVKMEDAGWFALRREGFREGSWVLLDYGDLIVHVFQDAERQFYKLERLWGDARVIETSVNI